MSPKCLGNASIETFGDISRHFETFRDISLAGRQWPAILEVTLLADSLFYLVSPVTSLSLVK